MRNLVLLFVLVAFLYPLTVKGQSPVQTPLSYDMLLPNFQKSKPTPMAFDSYGNYEASEYTGSLDITIPLCEARSGDVVLPLSLKYDATGVKVSQQASPVGLSWGLNFGGSITHIVGGQDDYNTRPTLTDKQFLDSIYSIASGYHTAYVPQDYHIDWSLGLNLSSTSQLYQNSAKLYWRSLLMEDLAHGMHVPDVFQANFCGRTVSFILDKQNGNKVTILNDNACKYKIEAKYNLSVWPEQFVIIDDCGDKYIFKSFSEYDQLDSYYLTEIQGLNPNNIITIAYSQYRQKGQYDLYQSIGKLESASSGDYGDLSSLLGIHSRASSPSKYKDVVSPTQIESNQEKIVFELENRQDIIGARAIKCINVISKNGNTQTHHVLFSYGYFQEESHGEGKSTVLTGGEDSDYPAKRLKLKQVAVDDKKYTFFYDESIALPYVTSLSQDYWGYYNGINNRTNFCSSPAYAISGTKLSEIANLGDANRLASPIKMGCGMLSKIVYPTGGYSVFEFEPHHFYDAYYYPRAEHPSCKHTSSITVSSVAAQKNKPNGQSFQLTEEKDVEFSVNINAKDPANHPCSATIWCANGNSYREVFSTSTSTPGMSRTFTRRLKPGVYVIYVTVPYVPSDYATVATISAVTGYSYSLDYESSDASGLSLGGGLRIKSITNYDGKKLDFVSKTIYKYNEGKLLVPTVRRKVLSLNYTPNGGSSVSHLTYSFVGSQMSELAIMSLGVPTIGYSTVTARNVDAEGNDNGYVVTTYENVPYQEIGTGGQFYYANYGLNGKVLNKSVFNSSDELVKETKYTYGTTKYEEVLFPKCTPLFLGGTRIEGCDYRLSIYSKANVWNYLKTVSVTDYVAEKPMLPTVTNYAYNDNNYKERQILVKDGSNVQTQKKMFYPIDRLSAGSDVLLEKHCLSEITGVNEYQGRNSLLATGGYHKDYLCVNRDLVCVSDFYSKNTDGSKHLDLKVVRYDSYGNILEYTTASGEHVVLLWSYSHQYPVMEIRGVTYDEVVAASPLVSQLGSKSSLTELELLNLHSSIVNSTKGHATAYLYNSWYKVSEMIYPNGNSVRYNYDEYGRLVSEQDIENHPISTYKYNYRQ